MTVVAPGTDGPGTVLQSQIATVQALVTAGVGPVYQYQQQLNMLQTELVDHFMATGWLSAAAIVAAYPLPAWDKVGARIVALIANTQNLVNSAPAPSPLANGWVTVAQNYQQLLYQQQSELVDYLMAFPGGTSAATILAGMTGSQSFPFGYSFNSVGYTDASLDD